MSAVVVCACVCASTARVRASSLQSCSTLRDPMDCSPPGSSVHGIFQARILRVTISSSGGSSPPRDRTRVSYISYTGRQVLYHSCHLGSPCNSRRATIISTSTCQLQSFCHISGTKLAPLWASSPCSLPPSLCEGVLIFFFFFNFWPHWGACGILVPLTRDQIRAPCNGSRVLTTGLPGKS